jgi:DNA replication and repair protein RecF
LNGVGKTNILDAVFYLCMCKSYFQHLDTDIFTKDADQVAANIMRLEGIFERNGRKERVVAKVQHRKKKIFERNDAPYAALSEHVGLLPIVMIAPDDVQLATEGSEERRRFMDNTLSQMDNQYLQWLIQYNKILDQRNAFLKKQAAQHAPHTGGGAENALLDVYDQQLLTPAAYIFEKRQQFIAALTPIFNELYQKISDAREMVVLTYQSRLHGQNFADLLLQSRQKDLILGRTTIGIHRDDLGFEIDQKPLKKFGSQGQLKSFVVSLKLAQHQFLANNELQLSPILLLDDIFDKLDDQRIANLLQLLTDQRIGQILLSDTHPQRTEAILTQLNIPFQLFHVEKNAVKKA